jgi:ribosomal protein S27AE
MWAALAYMTRAGVKSAGNVHITARTYDFVKRQDAAWRSIRYTEKNHYRGKTHSPEVREKMRGPRPSIAGENHPRFGKSLAETNELIAFVRKPRDLVLDLTVRDRINALIVDKPKELRALIERYRRSAAMSEAAKARDSNGAANPNFGNGQAIAGERNPMFGKAHADSTKAKIGAKAKRRVTCPHCGKGGNIANMARWHFGNCRDPRNPALAAPVRADSGH